MNLSQNKKKILAIVCKMFSEITKLKVSPSIDSALKTILAYHEREVVDMTFIRQLLEEQSKKDSKIYKKAVKAILSQYSLSQSQSQNKICVNCKKEMRPQIDPISGKLSEHLYHCDCMPENVNVSIG